MKERLQKIISSAGITSRRNAEKLIEDGKITVNGTVAKLGDTADAQSDIIIVNGKKLEANSSHIYIMLNKPKGYVTTLSDEKGRKNVAQLINIPQRVYPVGRLDMYSEGLLLLTNDGEFANLLSHPKNTIDKTYKVTVSGNDISKSVQMLKMPMNIDGYVIKPAAVEIEALNGDKAELLITIHEGRNRQIRKMCDIAGCRVLNLCRISEGGLSLGDLKTGHWRYLSKQEVAMLQDE